MRAVALGASLVALLLTVNAVQAQQNPIIQVGGSKPWPPYPIPYCPPVEPSMPLPGTPTPPADPNVPAPAAPMASDQFAGATEAGTQPAPMFNPVMFGDLIGVFSQRSLLLPNPNARFGATGVVNPIRTLVHGVPIVGQYTGFKIAQNESPRPLDRVFATYDGFSNVGRSSMPSSVPNLNVQQQLIGFEKTFLDGDASFGMRLPFAQLNGFSDVQMMAVGDLSLVSKYAFLNNTRTGNVFSGGLVVTVPISTIHPDLADGKPAPHAAILQPWAGGIYNMNRAYIQGFSSLGISTVGREPTIFFNSLGAGYWLYRDSSDAFLTSFVPVAELHLNTPLNGRSPNNEIYFQDQLNVTAGAYTTFRRMTIGTAVGFPMIGPRPYHIEGIASFNLRF